MPFIVSVDRSIERLDRLIRFLTSQGTIGTRKQREPVHQMGKVTFLQSQVKFYSICSPYSDSNARANSVESDQTAQDGAVCSGSTLFASSYLLKGQRHLVKCEDSRVLKEQAYQGLHYLPFQAASLRCISALQNQTVPF